MAFTVTDALWNTFAGALFGGLIASGIVAYLTQRLTEQRERRNRRDQLRLDLYLDIVDLVLDNELALASIGSEGSIPSIELQATRLRTYHRSKLLASAHVQAAYDDYRKLVDKRTTRPHVDRPDIDEVEASRGKLIDLMSRDVGAD